jgi:quercetin dioxygenase-like cupin family protein
MLVFLTADAPGFEPAGHFGGLTVKDVVDEAASGSFRAQLSVCPPGGGGEMHSHADESQLFVVLSGEYVFDNGEEEFTLGALDAVMFAPGEPHATRNDSGGDTHVLVVTAKA